MYHDYSILYVVAESKISNEGVVKFYFRKATPRSIYLCYMFM